jgi:hypothetical protein
MFLDVLAIMDEENFTDVGVPKGPCLVIMKGTWFSFHVAILAFHSCLAVHNALLHACCIVQCRLKASCLDL